MPLKKAIFLDRDGTLNRDTGYLIRFEDFELLPGVEKALLLLQSLGYALFVVTNQSGVARGYFSYQEVVDLHLAMMELFKSRGIYITDIAFCPHHPKGQVPDFTRECLCRKPGPGMLLDLADKHGIDMAASYMVGDKCTDAEAGSAAGCRGIWLTSAAWAGPLKSVDKPENIKEFLSLLDFAENLREFDGR